LLFYLQKYDINVNPEYLNIFGQLKEIPLRYSKYISKFFPYELNVNRHNLQITNVGMYSITKPYVTKQIITIMQDTIELISQKNICNLTITDGTGGVGGDAIIFTKYFKFTNVVEIMKSHSDIIKNNLKVYKRQNYTIYNQNYLDIYNTLTQDIVYLDSPWGGVGYKDQKHTELYLFGSDLSFNKFVYELILKKNDIIIFVKCPINYNVFQLSEDIHKISSDKNLKVSFVSNFLLLTIY